MQSQFELLKRCIFAPQLYYINRGNKQDRYPRFLLEKISDHFINTVYYCVKASRYIIPLYLLHDRFQSVTVDNLMTTLNLMAGLGLALMVTYLIRGYSRTCNPQYLEFLKLFKVIPKNRKRIPRLLKKQLMNYEFDFKAWPVEFSYKTNRSHLLYCPLNLPNLSAENILKIPLHLVAYCAIYTFGITLIYPGSVAIVYYLLEKSLHSGRKFLIERCGGERFKIETEDGNCLDTMFIDSRNGSTNGKNVVICTEGNSGFYEIGIMQGPIDKGFSVLGWNHPGFAHSTGTPYPAQEQNAINAVIRFAIDFLGFAEGDIILYGWSIGGYASSWAASKYTNTKAVILDACFDDLLPLAVNHMPYIIEPLVRIAVKSYVDLNISELLCKYPGPVSLIRRTEDEIICTSPQDILTNRGNYLLLKLLKFRYPLIFGEQQLKAFEEFMSEADPSQSFIDLKYHLDRKLFKSMFEQYILEYSLSYPMMVGENIDDDLKTKLAIFLATTYVHDYKSSHCTPLPPEYFIVPKHVYLK